jgi:galactosylceramidase
MLFRPKYGASLQQLKVEIGCDGDTTQGSEQTHARLNLTDIDFDRGYEVWFMQEAAARHPKIVLSGLEWGVPGHIAAAKGGMWGDANAEYLLGWVTGLQEAKNLSIAALGVAYNERSYNTTFIKTMRKKLDAAGLEHVRTIAADNFGGKAWDIARDMEKDPELLAAVDIIGVHVPGPIHCRYSSSRTA